MDVAGIIRNYRDQLATLALAVTLHELAHGYVLCGSGIKLRAGQAV